MFSFSWLASITEYHFDLTPRLVGVDPVIVRLQVVQSSSSSSMSITVQRCYTQQCFVLYSSLLAWLHQQRSSASMRATICSIYTAHCCARMDTALSLERSNVAQQHQQHARTAHTRHTAAAVVVAHISERHTRRSFAVLA
jgi:hypothetical protein